MIIHECDQRSQEWFDLKKTRFSASAANTIMSAGRGLDTLIENMLVSKYSINHEDGYTNKHMERGNELEPLARSLYELETGNIVTEVGFIEIDEYIGFSPDGLVGEDGGVEIKCPADNIYMKILLGGEKKLPNGYISQCQFSLKYSERKWWDLVIFNPNFEKQMLIFRIEPDFYSFEKIQIGVHKGIELLNSRIKEYEEKMHKM